MKLHNDYRKGSCIYIEHFRLLAKILGLTGGIRHIIDNIML